MDKLGRCCASCEYVERRFRKAWACHMEITDVVYYCVLNLDRKGISNYMALALDSACEQWTEET